MKVPKERLDEVYALLCRHFDSKGDESASSKRWFQADFMRYFDQVRFPPGPPFLPAACCSWGAPLAAGRWPLLPRADRGGRVLLSSGWTAAADSPCG